LRAWWARPTWWVPLVWGAWACDVGRAFWGVRSPRFCCGGVLCRV
jgi:hypothetical protein